MKWVAVVAVFLFACVTSSLWMAHDIDQKLYGPKKYCVHTHLETYTWYEALENDRGETTFVPVTGTHNVCDQWQPAPGPLEP